jgi:DNA topoisomerase VI subunit B
MSEASKRTVPLLDRAVFRTSRLADFCGVKELTAQTGHAPEDWPVVIGKELIDNGLDECEEAEIGPEISIAVSTECAEIVIADNGRGLPSETIQGIIDYTIRVSSREAYVSPTRGAQGNALKTIVAMPFALDGRRGITVVESHGLAHRIGFEVDPVRREPKPLLQISPSPVQKGTRITVCWPDSACSLLEQAETRFVQMAADFTAFNPHLTLSCRWNGQRRVNMTASNPDWRKWRACDLTSAHWYDTERFERYMAAHIARDEDQGRAGRTVREFIAELRGLTRSDKQKVVLAAVQAAGMPLASFFGRDDDAIALLLAQCQQQTKPVAPKDLGVIGSDHFLADCCAVGAAEESFKYKKRLGETASGLPYAIEVAFAYRPEATSRLLVTGVNFSVGIRNPFQRLAYFDDLSSQLTRRMAGPDEPIVVMLHYTCPRVDYTDRGKSTLSLPFEIGAAIRELVEAVTKEWYTQRKREEKEASRKIERRDRLISTKKVSIKDAAWQAMQAPI